MSSATATVDNMPAGAGSGAGGSTEKASLTTWIAILAGMVGAFMAILNIQITNASLLLSLIHI